MFSGGSVVQSLTSGPASTSNISAASATVRVIGPACDSVPKGLTGQRGILPYVGFRATMPQKPAGILTEPPPSVPTASCPIPSATAAAAPPLEPPAVYPGAQGLPVNPVRGLSVTPFHPYSGVVVFPRRTAPCSRSRATTGASSYHSWSGSTIRDPRSVGHPQVRKTSFMEAGTPSRRPLGSPVRYRSSDSRAWASACSASTRQKALTRGLYSSIWRSAASVASTGESSRARYSFKSSVAGRKATSLMLRLRPRPDYRLPTSDLRPPQSSRYPEEA